jgi:glycosyltransferase involved in cell wall biosynthesis
MKILFLADANSIHTIKWVESLHKHELNILVFSLFKPTDDVVRKYQNWGIPLISADLQSKIRNLRVPNISKLNYLTAFRLLKKTMNAFAPDIIHAHYASSYGVLGYLSKFKPFILSVWGSDVYDFPQKNQLNKWLLKKVIHSASSVCSTSEAMKAVIATQFDRFDVKVIPFGVDVSVFAPALESPQQFTVGTIKSIEAHNGIDCLLDAANIIINEYHNTNIHFLIVGQGSLLGEMKQKTTNMGLNNYVKFAGYIPHEKIVEFHQKLSVFISVSTRESFGVAVLEAAACGVPAITSNVGGLPEVNQNNYTGYVIPPNDPEKLANSIFKLFKDKNLKDQMEKNARDRVAKQFNWNKNVIQMVNVYQENEFL